MGKETRNKEERIETSLTPINHNTNLLYELQKSYHN